MCNLKGTYFKGDNMTKCIYNNNRSNITVYDDYFTIGKKNIKYADVHSIKKDCLTNYLSLFTKNLFTFLFLSANLVFYFIFKELRTLFVLSSILVLLLVVYYFRRIHITKMFKDTLFVLYDIVYKTHHDTLIVALTDDVSFNKKKLRKLKYMETHFLQRYLTRIKQGRKYLFSQIESTNSTGDVLYEKYKTVAQIRYKDTQAFDKRVISHFETTINEKFSLLRRYTLYMFRFNVIMTIVAIFYFVSSWDNLF